MQNNSLSPDLRAELLALVTGLIEHHVPETLNDNEDEIASERFVVVEGTFDARSSEITDGESIVFLLDRSGNVPQDEAPILARIIIQTEDF